MWRAQKVKDSCLKALKERYKSAAAELSSRSHPCRLIDRAHIIETRLEEEQAALTKKQVPVPRPLPPPSSHPPPAPQTLSQVGYQRQDKDKTSDDEEYEKYVNEAQFRIQILKQRRDRHEEIAKAKFKEMIERLQNDPRLAILNQ